MAPSLVGRFSGGTLATVHTNHSTIAPTTARLSSDRLRMTTAAKLGVQSTKADPNPNTAAISSPTGIAILNPDNSPVNRTPGVPTACRPRKPPVAKKAKEISSTRASPRRVAASPAKKANPNASDPTAANTTKWSFGFSQWGSSRERSSNETKPMSGNAPASTHAAVPHACRGLLDPGSPTPPDIATSYSVIRNPPPAPFVTAASAVTSR